VSDPAATLVLVVDDSESGRYATVRFLRHAGFRVIEAAEGYEGLRLARTERPDIVLLDVSLPDVSGLEVCRRIKEDAACADTLVVQVSASFVRPSDAVRGLEAGADGYLTEPIEPTVLVATINALLRIRRAEERARLAAAQLEATFDAISEGVCLLDRHGIVRNCNNALAMLAGRPADEIVGRSWDDLVHDWLGAEIAVLPARLQRDRVQADVAIADRWLHVTVDRAPRGTAPRAGAVCTVSDVTERKRADEANAALLARERFARSEAEAANRSKDDFLAVLSHELRTPLTAILGWVRTLRLRPTDTAALARGLEVIERNTRMLTQLIEDLLDVSRIIAGKLSLERKPTRIAAVVEAAVDGIRGVADAQGVALGLVVTDPTLRVDADGARLQQVFTNLLSNGVKFTPAGGRVDVDVRARDGSVVVTVRDTGRGISPAFLPYVFDRFRQADGAMTRTTGGLGLGLAIVRHLVELHGGTVAVESDGDNRGAAFTVTLPAVADGGPGVVRARREALGASPRLDGMRVLVVEDNADTREMVAMILSGAGAAVRTVASAAAAEAALEGVVWDMIVSDLGMPEGDGYELIRRVRGRSSTRRLPAIALSAHATDADARLSLSAGFDVHLPKPVDPDDLVRVVASLVMPGSVRAG
jgi:PAS domain S-box-containing protein